MVVNQSINQFILSHTDSVCSSNKIACVTGILPKEVMLRINGLPMYSEISKISKIKA